MKMDKRNKETKRMKTADEISLHELFSWSLTFWVVGVSRAYSAQRPGDEDDVINAGHVVAEELGAITVGFFHT